MGNRASLKIDRFPGFSADKNNEIERKTYLSEGSDLYYNLKQTENANQSKIQLQNRLTLHLHKKVKPS